MTEDPETKLKIPVNNFGIGETPSFAGLEKHYVPPEDPEVRENHEADRTKVNLEETEAILRDKKLTEQIMRFKNSNFPLDTMSLEVAFSTADAEELEADHRRLDWLERHSAARKLERAE